MVFAFPIICYTWWSPAFLEMDEQQAGKGSSELIPCFGLFAHTTFPLSIKLSSSQPVFSHFYPSHCLAYPTVG